MMSSAPAAASSTPETMVLAVWNLSCGICAADEPNTGDEDEQETDFGKTLACVSGDVENHGTSMRHYRAVRLVGQGDEIS